MREWRGALESGLRRMADRGVLRDDADPARLATSVFAAVQGGLLLTRTEQGLWPLDGALTQIRAAMP